MGFLNKHCQLAWEIAVYNCKLIFSGLTDLHQRKVFVSTFENAIELCFKQMLLDQNNTKVIDEHKISDQTLLTNFKASTDLNLFFQNLYINSPETLDSLYSAQIKNISGICTSGITKQSDVLKRIDLLLRLRNNETHFFIDESSYLSIDEFKQLCTLMQEMQNWFISKNVIEHETTLSAPRTSSCKYQGYFDEDINKLVSYDSLIINGEQNLMLLSQFPKYQKWDYIDNLPNGWWFYVDDVDDNYSICYSIFEHHGVNDPDMICLDFLMNLNEFYRRFILMRNNNLIIVEKNPGFNEDITKPFVIVSKA